jgi:hypothetical protein
LLCFSYLLICCHCIYRSRFIPPPPPVLLLSRPYLTSFRIHPRLSMCSCSIPVFIRCFMQAVFPDNCVILSFLSNFGIYAPQDSFDIVWNYIMLNLTGLRIYPFPPVYSLLVCVYL